MLSQLTFGALSSILLGACFPYQAASSGPVGCAANDIEIRGARMAPGAQGPTRTWTAICYESEHLCSAIGMGGAACTRIAPVETIGHERSGQWLERGFDSRQGAPNVRAHVRVDVRRWLEVFASPRTQAEVAVTMRLLKHRGVPCDGVQWTVNGAPLPTIPVRASDEGPTLLVKTQLGPDLVRELQRPRPSLSVEGCGQSMAIGSDVLDTLVEFAAVYADLEASEGTSTSSLSADAEQNER